MAAEPKPPIPVLTETVDGLRADVAGDRETLIAELQTQIASGAFALTDEIMRTAFAEMEANIFEKISGQLRRELPEMIDRLLRERLAEDSEY
jgi:hypothetical protein